ncbi:PREDICTED: SAM pointed domain-containing Ets transcription factor isoform X4 [Lepidothrix coronata]|uniref:SAM pointed domain-containing Ets transcription factor isoform X4 n=1 Tax=Lepidothrix coronata TaxID=321398 RepID=A0A6J0IXG3_9PASS|nr:PREDICTED: SAM pointed domain-containing Ets transcription factor isoform X4 [Lepidothrix coronata]
MWIVSCPRTLEGKCKKGEKRRGKQPPKAAPRHKQVPPIPAAGAGESQTVAPALRVQCPWWGTARAFGDTSQGLGPSGPSWDEGNRMRMRLGLSVLPCPCTGPQPCSAMCPVYSCGGRRMHHDLRALEALETPIPSPDIPMAATVQLHKLLPLPFCARSSVGLDLGLISYSSSFNPNPIKESFGSRCHLSGKLFGWWGQLSDLGTPSPSSSSLQCHGNRSGTQTPALNPEPLPRSPWAQAAKGLVRCPWFLCVFFLSSPGFSKGEVMGISPSLAFGANRTPHFPGQCPLFSLQGCLVSLGGLGMLLSQCQLCC